MFFCFILLYLPAMQCEKYYHEGDILVVSQGTDTDYYGRDQYASAVRMCGVFSKRLVIIQDRTKLETIMQLMRKYKLQNIPLGLKRIGRVGRFEDYRWQNDEPMTFTAWNGIVGRHECVGMAVANENDTSLNTWFTAYCDDIRIVIDGYICEAFSQITPGAVEQLTPGNMTESGQTFVCGSNELISVIYVCDGVTDCNDASDETQCDFPSMVGSDHQYTCDNKKRIPIDLRCDFIKDCPDGSDEKGCVYPPCLHGYWQCYNGQCIKDKNWCDYHSTCVDGSDELDEVCKAVNPDIYPNECESRDREFCPCDNVCYPRERNCDRYLDCSGNVDESMNLCGQYFAKSYYTCGAALQITNATERNNQLLNFGRYSDKYTTKYKYKCLLHATGLVSTTVQNFHTTLMILYHSASHSVMEVWDYLLKTGLQCSQWIKIVCNGSNPVTDIKWSNEVEEKVDPTVQSIPVVFNSECSCEDENNPKSCERRFKWDLSIDDMLNGNYDDKDYIKISNHSQLPFNHLLENKGAGVYGILLGPLVCVEDPKSIPEKYLNDKMKCKSGGWYFKHDRCLLRMNRYGDAEICRDLSHLDNCEHFRCPEEYIKCPNSFCVHVTLLQDGIKHCVNGEDEYGVYNYSCPGYFKCRRTRKCLPANMICDGERQCPEGDDERLCTPCQTGCSCSGLRAKCKDFTKTYNAIFLAYDLKYLDLSDNILGSSDIFPVSVLQELVELKLYNCSIKSLNNIDNITNLGLFEMYTNLMFLDLSMNLLREIAPYIFKGLSNLRKLDLSENGYLSHLREHCFDGMDALEELRFVKTGLIHLGVNIMNLNSLQYLNISRNSIQTVGFGAFRNLISLKMLDIRGNKFRVQQDMFLEMESLAILYSDSFTFCCVTPVSVTEDKCVAPRDDLSSCYDLIKMNILRGFLWFVALAALIGNASTLFYRIVKKRNAFKMPYSILVTNLGISDLLMGIYLTTIAIVDAKYRGMYVWNEYEWRTSTMCMVAGIMAMVSSEASVMFICFITFERFVLIKYVYKTDLVTRRTSTISSILIWIVSLSFGIIPIFVYPDFYSRESVCVALPLHSERLPGWYYSVAVFLIFNSVAFFFIAILQFKMYKEIKHTSARVRSNKTRKEHAIARTLFLVVMTDFLCWIPIGIMGLMTAFGHYIHGDVYAWVIVFVLPVNSALNPFLYTFASLCKDKIGKGSTAKSEESIFDLDTTSTVVKIMNNDLMLARHDPRGLHIDHLPRELTIYDLFKITFHITKAIKLLHSHHIVHGKISKEYLRIFIDGQVVTSASLVMYEKRLLCDWDTFGDLANLGVLIKELLQITNTGKHSISTTL